MLHNRQNSHSPCNGQFINQALQILSLVVSIAVVGAVRQQRVRQLLLNNTLNEIPRPNKISHSAKTRPAFAATTLMLPALSGHRQALQPARHKPKPSLQEGVGKHWRQAAPSPRLQHWRVLHSLQLLSQLLHV
jgi:hypothetical protein